MRSSRTARTRSSMSSCAYCHEDREPGTNARLAVTYSGTGLLATSVGGLPTGAVSRALLVLEQQVRCNGDYPRCRTREHQERDVGGGSLARP